MTVKGNNEKKISIICIYTNFIYEKSSLEKAVFTCTREAL